MQKDERVGIVNIFFDIEKNYNYELKNQYLRIIKIKRESYVLINIYKKLLTQHVRSQINFQCNIKIGQYCKCIFIIS